jgi:hypothetical protein
MPGLSDLVAIRHLLKREFLYGGVNENFIVVVFCQGDDSQETPASDFVGSF